MKYNKIIKHYENCFELHGDNHKGADWPNIEDAKKRYQVMLEVIKNQKEAVNLLDFGCGSSQLYTYILDKKISNINYSGLEISKTFIDYSLIKYPDINYYHLDILKTEDQIPNFDYITCNGVFTEKRELTFDEMWAYTQKLLLTIFEKADKGIAFNVMSKSVDWERWDLFHLPTDLLIDFMTKKLSRNFVIRNDYGLYEYTVYIYK